MNQMQKAEEYKSPAIKVITSDVVQVLCISNPERYSTDTKPEQDVF